MADDGFTAHCLELLAPHGSVRAKRMFGGVGLYVDELFVALIAGDRLYLKVDSDTREAFLAAGGEPFVFESRGRSVTMSYCTPPTEAMDGPAQMAPWARRAIAAALAARAKAPAPRAVQKPGRPGPR